MHLAKSKLVLVVTSLGISATALAADPPTLPPILGIGAKTCIEVEESVGFNDPAVTSWLEGFITGMEAAGIAHLQIWGRRIAVATPQFIAMELEWRCKSEGGSTLVAVLATKILDEIPSDFPGE